MLEITVSLVSVASGVAIKAVWDAVVRRKEQIERAQWEARLNDLSKSLGDFYWPIYLRLQRDNIIWRRILDRNSPDEEKRKLAREIEETVLIPNHQEILNILDNKIHLAEPDEEFEKWILAYIRHAHVYLGLRSAGIWDKDPIDLEEPWPKEFFELLEPRLNGKQEEYNRLITKRKK